MCLARLIDSEDVNFIEIPKSMHHSARTRRPAGLVPGAVIPRKLGRWSRRGAVGVLFLPAFERRFLGLSDFVSR